MKKILLSFSSALLLSLPLQAQNFRAFIGTPKLSEVALDNKSMPDGGVVIVGYSTALNADGRYDYKTTDMLIVRLDATGNVMWSHVIGIGNGLEDKFQAVAVTRKGDVVAVGGVGHIPFTIGAPGTPGRAAAYCFDGNTGAQLWFRHVHSDNGRDKQQGDVYTDVVVKDDGNPVAVGTRDARPEAADGLATLFDGGSGNVLQNQAIIQSERTDGLSHVTTDGKRIFVNGFFIGNSYYDLSVMELDGNSLVPNWSKQYDYGFSMASDPSNVVTCQWAGKISYFKERLVMQAYTTVNYYGLTPGVTGYITVNSSDGGSPVLTRGNHDAFDYQNNPSVYFAGLNDAFTTANPAKSPASYVDLDMGGGAPYGAYLTELDPGSATPATAARRLLRASRAQHGITTVHGQNGILHYSGVSKGDGSQIGEADILYVRSVTGVPGTISEECATADVKIERDRNEIKEDYLKPGLDKNFKEDQERLKEDKEMKSVVICGQTPPPCSIDNVSYSVSLTNPYTYTFNANLSPAGSAITFYVNSSPIVSSFLPLTYTFPGPGYYWICMELQGEDGKPCAEKCFGICIAENSEGAAQPASRAKQSRTMTGFEIGNPYPNPTSNQLNIPVQSAGGASELRITTIDGRTVLTESVKLSAGQQLLQVGSGKLPAGTYLLQLSTPEGKQTKTFTKQ